MKQRALIFWGIIMAVAMMVSSVFAADKFAYLDLSRTFSQYGKTKDYDKSLTEKQNVYEGEMDKKLNEIKQLQDKINLLSDKEKEARKSELDAKVKAVQEFRQQKSTDLRKEQDERMREILKDIEEAVKQFSEKEGYTMVFNDRVLVYQTKNMDITDSIVGILNKGYKK